LVLAQASRRVPSTEKCPVESRVRTFGCASTVGRNRLATSPASSRSRFLVKVVASHTGSSTPRPTNQRNSRSKSSRSTSWRSERIE
jgi:hypothetical protein